MVMTTEEVTSKLLDYAITLVDYCCNQEECNEARLFELEAINDLNEENEALKITILKYSSLRNIQDNAHDQGLFGNDGI